MGAEWLWLFDIDGTLVHSGGAGRRALARAIRHRYGVHNAITFSLAGRSDRWNFVEALARIGHHHAFEGPPVQEMVRGYLEHLPSELATVPGAPHCVGTDELVAYLAQTGTRIGLVTGNLRVGADVKLAWAGFGRVGETFVEGGFGDDHEERAQIVHAALARFHGHPASRTIVVGDTPLDVFAAQAEHCHALAVATGNDSLVRLEAAHPTLAVADLADWRHVLERLGERLSG